MASRTSSTDPRRPGRATGRRSRRPGFSLTEALTASVVLAVGVIGVAGPLTAASQQAEVARETATAVVLAKELMEEVAAKPLLDGNGTSASPGPEAVAGETARAAYDSADDYHGYTDSTATLKNLANVAVAAPKGYTRRVTVEYRTSPSGAATSSGDYGLVTVSVTTPQGQTIKVARLLCKSRVSSTS